MKGALRVLVVAEGPSEIGDRDQLAVAGSRKKRAGCDGYVLPLLRTMLDVPLQIDAQRITALGRFEKPIQGHGDRAAKALALAAVDGYGLLVFVKDVDKTSGIRSSVQERRKKLREMHAEIEAGFGAVGNAEGTLRAKATPCRMIEAWALGDAAAISEVGGRGANLGEIADRPEELWGREDEPASNHPKCALRRALGRTVDARVFESLGGQTSPATLRGTCPESFAPFADEIEQVAKAFARQASPKKDEEVFGGRRRR